MWRAAARAVRNSLVKSSSSISAIGFPCAEGCVIAFIEMSIPPASAVTASACSSTAFLVERVDHRRLGRPACGADLSRDRIERLTGPAGEEDPRSLAGEGARHGATDGSGGAVDHGVLALEEHLSPPSQPQAARRAARTTR